MTPSGVIKVGVLAPLPVQYQAPFFARLAAEPWIDLTVMFGSGMGTSQADRPFRNFGHTVNWGMDLLEGYRHVILGRPSAADWQDRASMIGVGIVPHLVREAYDVLVIFGWGFVFDWLAFVYASITRTPFLLYTDTDVRELSHPGNNVLRRMLLARVCSAASGALWTGTFNRDFYIRHGMAPERLWFSPWAVDTARFGRTDRRACREALGLRDIPYLVFTGALIERKRPRLLLAALRRLQETGLEVGLLIVGSGPLEDDLRAQVRRERLSDVNFLGFLNQTDLPEAYAAADIFVLPSQEDPRATVVNEAMAAGLPVVVSSGTGVWGPGDLVRHGEEGLVFAADDEAAAVAACRDLVGDPALRGQMAAAAQVRSRKWSYEVALAGWRAAVLAVGQPGATGRATNPPTDRS